MDFTKILMEHFTLVVMVACLVVGHIIKHASFLKWQPNNELEGRDGEMWRKVNGYVLAFVVGSVFSFVFTQLGI